MACVQCVCRLMKVFFCFKLGVALWSSGLLLRAIFSSGVAEVSKAHCQLKSLSMQVKLWQLWARLSVLVTVCRWCSTQEVSCFIAWVVWWNGITCISVSDWGCVIYWHYLWTAGGQSTFHCEWASLRHRMVQLWVQLAPLFWSTEYIKWTLLASAATSW